MDFLQKSIFAALLMGVSLVPAVAADKYAQSILNSTRTLEYLHSVTASEIKRPLDYINEGKFKRPYEHQPMWIVEILGGSILYYQGEPTFRNQPASRLIDDVGGRFGERAIAMGKASRSGWVKLSLGKQGYQAYCKSQYPFVACTLAI